MSTPAYTVTVDMPNLGKGEEVEISGLGRFKNGSTTEVSKEDAEAFRVFHQKVTYTHEEDGALQTHVEPGPTVLQAFEKAEGVKVATYEAPKADAKTTSKTPDAANTTTQKGGDS